MQRVKRSTAVAALPAAPAGGTPGFFAAPNPGGGIVATVPGYEWYNAVQEELVAAAILDGATLGVSGEQIAGVLAARLRCLKTGTPLPVSDIGPIWHDDYNSLMTWQTFTANSAAYTGYASVLVGGLLIDTQPTPRAGYVRSGVSNLSRTAYAALRGWAMHNGIMVASGTWAAGTIAVKDNADGTTFTAFDVRGEFPRFFDDARGVDSGRLFGSGQGDLVKDHYHKSAYADAGAGYTYRSYSSANNITAALDNHDAMLNGGAENRPRNVALLATIKF